MGVTTFSFLFIFPPVVNVGDKFSALVRTLASVITQKHSDGVDWQNSKVCAASETSDRSGR